MVRLDRMAESGSKDFLRTPGRSFTGPRFELGLVRFRPLKSSACREFVLEVDLDPAAIGANKEIFLPKKV